MVAPQPNNPLAGFQMCSVLNSGIQISLPVSKELDWWRVAHSVLNPTPKQDVSTAYVAPETGGVAWVGGTRCLF